MSFVTSRTARQRALLRQRNRNTDPDRKSVSPALAAGRSMVALQTRIETLHSSTENVDRTNSNDARGTVGCRPSALPSDAKRVGCSQTCARSRSPRWHHSRLVHAATAGSAAWGRKKENRHKGGFDVPVLTSSVRFCGGLSLPPLARR